MLLENFKVVSADHEFNQSQFSFLYAVYKQWNIVPLSIMVFQVIKNCNSDTTRTVSYTHLDVYKRQAVYTENCCVRTLCSVIVLCGF